MRRPPAWCVTAVLAVACLALAGWTALTDTSAVAHAGDRIGVGEPAFVDAEPWSPWLVPPATVSPVAAPATQAARADQLVSEPDGPTLLDPAGAHPDPVAVHLPTLDVHGPVIPLAVRRGRIEVPEDAGVAGWWRDGPEPGEPGAAVVLGHVDSWRGPGVFAGLHSLEVGDEVHLDRADGSTAVFAVQAGRLYGKDEFPTDRVYDLDLPVPSLRLVTCGGEFDREAGSYEANFVVYAELLRIDPPAPTRPGA